MDDLVAEWNAQTLQITDLLNDLKSVIEARVAPLTELRVRVDVISTLYAELSKLYYRLRDNERAKNKETFDNTKRLYFQFAGIVQSAEKKVESKAQDGTSHNNTTGPLGNSTMLDISRFQGLPTIELPKFDGRLEEWTAFKMNFRNEMVRLGLDNITAFHYLKRALVGAAAGSLKILVPGENSYEEAWHLLDMQYEHVRLIADTHIKAILEYPPIVEVSHQALKDMERSVRQHLLVLKTLKLVPLDYWVIHALERALIPDLESFFSFLQETSNYLYAKEGKATEAPALVKSGKRAGQQNETGAKFRRGRGQARALVSNSSLSCYHCSGAHTIYRCPEFAKLSVQQRWNAVKTKKLCRKCLRAHEGKCEARNCKKCDKEHNTLLHEDSKADSSVTKP